MCSKNDSDATYCSEVEEFLKATTVTSKKICKDVPLRRSQRLYEKLKKSTTFTGSNVDTTNSEKEFNVENIKVSLKSYVAKSNKFTQDIFTTQDVRQVDDVSQYYISLNEIVNCASKFVPVTYGVPLDLSKKSKVSARETPKGSLQAVNATVELENCNIKNVLEIAHNDNKENANLSTTPKLDILHFSKPRRSRNSSSNKSTKAISNPNKKSVIHNSKNRPVKSPPSVDQNTNTEELSSDLKKLYKTTCKTGLQSLKKMSTVMSGKSIELLNCKINNSTEIQSLGKMPKQKLLSGNKTGRKRKYSRKYYTKVLPAQSSTDQDSKKIPTKTPEPVKVINNSANISFDKINSCQRSCNRGRPLNKKPTLISAKRIKLTNDIKSDESILPESCTNAFIVTHTTKNFRNSLFANKNGSILKENNAKTDAVIDEINNLETKIKDNKKIQPIKKSRKRRKSVENISQSMTHSKEPQIEQNIKSEPFSSLNIVAHSSGETITIKALNNISVLGGKLSAENISATEAVRNNSQEKNETFISGVLPKYYRELNSDSMLRNAKTDIISENNANVENRNDNFGNECKRVISEIFSQRTSEEIKQIQPPQNIYSSRRIKKLSTQNSCKYASNDIELKNMNHNTAGANPHLSKRKSFFRKTPKPHNSIQNIKQTDENIQPKTEIENKNFIMNKNYIKSFDRTKFLDKIQNSRKYIEKLSTQNHCGKLNTYENTLTPAETSQDLLNRSILPDVYPPHFKHQLPPEAILTHSLDIQLHPSNVITPNDTISSELLESSSSSPSLPESLCEHFQTKHIKDILNVERKSYRLYNYHIQALALILNISLEHLSTVLDKIMNISPDVLKNIQKAVKMPFVPDNDLFPTSQNELWPSSEIVLNSQNPKQQKISLIADGIRC